MKLSAIESQVFCAIEQYSDCIAFLKNIGPYFRRSTMSSNAIIGAQDGTLESFWMQLPKIPISVSFFMTTAHRLQWRHHVIFFYHWFIPTFSQHSFHEWFAFREVGFCIDFRPARCHRFFANLSTINPTSKICWGNGWCRFSRSSFSRRKKAYSQSTISSPIGFQARPLCFFPSHS